MRRFLLIATLIIGCLFPASHVGAATQDTFDWAGGIEDTFIPQAKDNLRPLEEYELTQHYAQWKEDIDRAASLGITKLRWGVPWYKVEPKEGQYDWSWVDQVLDYMIHQKHIEPIVDLVHYGTPIWMEKSFADPNYSKYVSDYARAFAKRYGKVVRFYTPLNEPTVNAEFAGRAAQWPPYLNGDRGFVTVVMNIVSGMQRSIHAIREEDPNATIFAVEAMRLVQPGADPQRAKLELAKDLLPFDLVQGLVDEKHPLYDWLIRNGATNETLAALRAHPEHEDIFGVNYYPWSSLVVGADEKLEQSSTRGRLLFDVINNCYQHTRLPLFVTETSSPGSITERSLWMAETIDAVRAARDSNIPVIGYTWFPLFTMIEWEYRTSAKPIEQHLLHLGLWDSAFNDQKILVRKQTDLVSNYADWIRRGMQSMR